MTLVLIFLGWFILSSLWGFLPVIEPLRLFAISGARNRRTTAVVSAVLALVTGIILLLWVGSYSTVVIMTFDAHATSGSGQAQASANVIAITNELVLRQIVPGAGCFSADAGVCAIAAQGLKLGQVTAMLPVIGAASLIPALAAAFVCWKLTAPVETNPML